MEKDTKAQIIVGIHLRTQWKVGQGHKESDSPQPSFHPSESESVGQEIHMTLKNWTGFHSSVL